MATRYDDALRQLVAKIVAQGGRDDIEQGRIAFLRDAAGVLTVIKIEEPLAISTASLQEIARSLQSYVDHEYPVATPEELIDPDLADHSLYRRFEIVLSPENAISILLLNRRMVGADWLSSAQEPVNAEVPVIAFCSLKGGVGRSTALSLAARDLSQRGLRVLAVDLDLEAPGLGSMLLPPAARPEFGTLDYFVERGPTAFNDTDFTYIMEASPYFTDGAPVYVAPAFGAKTFANPENVLGKLSLAYLDDVQHDGQPKSFLDRARKLLTGLLAVRTFDVVLVDSRAGLHETSAASMLGLGADVLLFGTFQPQTFEGYLPLLAHISKLVERSDALLPRLRMVHAKADLNDQNEADAFRDASHLVFSSTVYEAPAQTVDDFELNDPAWFNVSDSDGPHYPWIISESASFRLFDPGTKPTQLDEAVMGEPYSDFLLNLRRLVMSKAESKLGTA